MAPEMMGVGSVGRNGKSRYANCVDVYSLGVLFWAMWTGRTPYETTSGTAQCLCSGGSYVWKTREGVKIRQAGGGKGGGKGDGDGGKGGSGFAARRTA
jgi:hypothetical protein